MERYLDRCLSSLIVRSELMMHLEILIINDGSRDRSSTIAHSYETLFPNSYRVIDKENGNYGSCINRGLKEAEGKYIKILDADDWFDTKCLENVLILLETLDVDCLMTDMQQVDENGKGKIIWNYSLPIMKEFSLKSLIDLRSKELIWMHCVAYRTENLRRINYYQTEGISYTDQEWLFLPMSMCKTIYYYPKILYKYLIGRENQTMDPSVYHKNFWQEVRGAIIMAQELYESKETLSTGYLYLRKRLIQRCGRIFAFYKKTRAKELYYDVVELDKYLKKNLPEIYGNFWIQWRDFFVKRRYGTPRSILLFMTCWRWRGYT